MLGVNLVMEQGKSFCHSDNESRCHFLNEKCEENTKNRNLIWPNHFQTPTGAVRHIYNIGDLSCKNGLKLSHIAPTAKYGWSSYRTLSTDCPYGGHRTTRRRPHWGIRNKEVLILWVVAVVLRNFDATCICIVYLKLKQI